MEGRNTTGRKRDTAEHYRRTRWFREYRGVSKYTLHNLARTGKVREIRDGNTPASPLAWCVEDYDLHMAEEQRLKDGGAR